MNVNVVLGCDYLRSHGHVDIDAGIFGALTDEVLRLIKVGKALPVRNNTACEHRGKGKKCSIECPNAVTVYQVGGHWSPQQCGKRM